MERWAGEGEAMTMLARRVTKHLLPRLKEATGLLD